MANQSNFDRQVSTDDNSVASPLPEGIGGFTLLGDLTNHPMDSVHSGTRDYSGDPYASMNGTHDVAVDHMMRGDLTDHPHDRVRK